MYHYILRKNSAATSSISEKKLFDGETVRETANMISFMADIIGIRDDMYIGKGNAYMREVSNAVREGYKDG